MMLLIGLSASAAQRKIYSFTATGAALNVDVLVGYNTEVTQVQINLSAVVTVDEPIYIRRLSSTGAVLAVYAINPIDTPSATKFTLAFDGFNFLAGETIAIDWANSGLINVTVGSNITYEFD
jgi:hypothetical protein